MTDQLLQLGDYSKPKPKGYYFDMYEWVAPVTIASQHITIDPRDYFITSGEAVTKGTVLEGVLWSVYTNMVEQALTTLDEEFENPLDALRYGHLLEVNRELHTYLLQSWRSACQARYLLIHLTEARGANLFLETDWSEGKVVCYPKNPRGVKF